jgi:hypothetical protein
MVTGGFGPVASLMGWQHPNPAYCPHPKIGATISALGLGVGMPQPAYYSTFDSAVFCYILNITVVAGLWPRSIVYGLAAPNPSILPSS